MKKPRKPGRHSPAGDPAAALNALDLAMQSQQMESEVRSLMRELLPLLDGVEKLCRGLDELPQQVLVRRADALAALAELADRIVEDIGLERDGSVGQPVDRDRHEVVDSIVADGAAVGEVVEIVESGWSYQGTLLRRAKVVAAAKG